MELKFKSVKKVVSTLNTSNIEEKNYNSMKSNDDITSKFHK
jgi:hypothetical protein